jgi:dimeric dUTPase (all-alpha-NTP-PPase superfamily)
MFSVLILYPNTQVYTDAVKKNLINPKRWLDFCNSPSKDFYLDYWEEFFTRKQLLDFQQKAFENFYLRPYYIWQSIKNLSSFEELKIKTRGFSTLIKSKFVSKR